MTKPYDIPKALVWEAYLSVKQMEAQRESTGKRETALIWGDFSFLDSGQRPRCKEG